MLIPTGLAAVLTRLGVAFGAKYPGPPQSTDATAWQGDPFSRGAYSFWRVGARATDVAEVGESHCERVLFAGEHTSVEYQGSVCGALESGRRAAREAGRFSRHSFNFVVLSPRRGGVAIVLHQVDRDALTGALVVTSYPPKNPDCRW